MSFEVEHQDLTLPRYSPGVLLTYSGESFEDRPTLVLDLYRGLDCW
jgi:hypothetical protein